MIGAQKGQPLFKNVLFIIAFYDINELDVTLFSIIFFNNSYWICERVESVKCLSNILSNYATNLKKYCFSVFL